MESEQRAPPDGRDDAALARLAAAGDRQAAGALVERHQAPVRRFLRRLTGRDDVADDLAQDTFVRMLRYADRYDPKYPMRVWLLTIARRLSINRGRREARLIRFDGWAWMRSAEPGPAERVGRADEARILREKLDVAMREVTNSQREALVLFHQQGLSVQEAAQVMGLPVGTVKSHLHRGRAALRRLLAGEIEGEES